MIRIQRRSELSITPRLNIKFSLWANLKDRHTDEYYALHMNVGYWKHFFVFSKIIVKLHEAKYIRDCLIDAGDAKTFHNRNTFPDVDKTAFGMYKTQEIKISVHTQLNTSGDLEIHIVKKRDDDIHGRLVIPRSYASELLRELTEYITISDNFYAENVTSD